MKLETILKAAISSMIRGHHRPHCYHAWIKGRGYVNDGENPETRQDYLVQLEKAARAETDNMGYATDYAEPGYDAPRKGILFADWNHLPRELDRILERAGYAVEWSDEWCTCGDCGRAIRTEPDSHSWESSFEIVDGDYLCHGAGKTPTGSPPIGSAGPVTVG